jgi:hypothetical protein
MSLFVLDTDILTLYYRGDPIVVRNVDARSPTDLAISVMTVDEQLTGWYTRTRQAQKPDCCRCTLINPFPACFFPRYDARRRNEGRGKNRVFTI